MKISYAITCCNEFKEIKRLLEQLSKNKKEEDEIVVLLDEPNSTEELKEYLREYKNIYIQEGKFENDFSKWKNQLNSLCNGDFIFQLDADEYLTDGMCENIILILQANPEVDLYYVPRINTVEGITEEYIQKWGWKYENGRINWPDYQSRIYRNSPDVKWKNKVHEVIEGHKQFTFLPAVDELALIHPKTIEKQEIQNNFYNTL
jgi:glycosyltransferase involved in cell wall biosynthesis